MRIVLCVVKGGVLHKYSSPPRWFFVETIRDSELAWVIA